MKIGTRPMPLDLAAGYLARAIFGEHRAYKRVGGVHTEGFELVVKTTVAPEKWPADRATYFEGHPVRWVHISRESEQ
jgi:hypothetical protein